MGCSDSTPQANNPKHNRKLLTQNSQRPFGQGKSTSIDQHYGFKCPSSYSYAGNVSDNDQTIGGNWQENYNKVNADNIESVHITSVNEAVTFSHKNVDSTKFSSVSNGEFKGPLLNEYDLNMTNFEEISFRQNAIMNNYNRFRAMRPIFRRHSLNDEYNRAQQSLTQYRGYPSRCRSLDGYDREMFNGKYIHGSSDNYSSDETIFRNNTTIAGNSQLSYQDTSTRWNCANNVRGVRCGGLKRTSWDEDDDETGISNSISDIHSQQSPRPNLRNFEFSCVEPRVKRRALSFEGVYSPDGENYETNHNDRSASENFRYYSDCKVTNDFTNESVNLKSFYSFSHEASQLDILDILSFPSEWSSCTIDKTGFVDISYSSPEGRSVERFFHRTSYAKEFKLHITGIARVENPFLHSLYLLKKEEMAARNGHVDELFLFHGTKKEYLSDICENNLNWRLFSEKHRFGQGVSFSPSASYSSHYCDKTVVKVMLLFKVLVSNASIGSAEMTVPPIKHGVTYDTSIKEDTTVIVKYCDNEFYPLYKIMYTKRVT